VAAYAAQAANTGNGIPDAEGWPEE